MDEVTEQTNFVAGEPDIKQEGESHDDHSAMFIRHRLEEFNSNPNSKKDDGVAKNMQVMAAMESINAGHFDDAPGELFLEQEENPSDIVGVGARVLLDGDDDHFENIEDPSINDETSSEPPPQKKRRTSASGLPPSAHNGKGTMSAAGKKPKLTKKQRQERREQDNLTNLSNGGLRTHVFEDAQANTARAEQPTFSATVRRDAMKQLLSNVPEESMETAKMDTRQMDKALRHFDHRACRPNGEGGWKLTGLKSVLTHYQMLGVAFMRRRENEGDQVSGVAGGLIADAMGLGKTVMCIANIINGKPAPGTKFEANQCRTTLIVVPSSLVTQWFSEIQKHADLVKEKRGKGLKSIGRHCSGYHMGDPDNDELTMMEMKKYDIIITTYSEVCRKYPKFAPPVECQTAVEKEAWWKQLCQIELGPLHKLYFRRVILDEATAIKNYRSRTSMACRAIQARFRWAVTGTPAENRSAEFYPYFKFLKVPNTGSFQVFSSNYVDARDGRGRERLYQMLKTFMLRRTHGDQLLGSKLLSLPDTRKDTAPLFLTAVEQQIYEVVHRRFVERINGISRAGAIQQCYTHIWTLLTRLRQLVSHPLLIQDTMRDLLEPDDFVALYDIVNQTTAEHQKQSFLLAHLRNMMANPKALEILEPDVISQRATEYSETREALSAALESGSFPAPHDGNGKAFAKWDSTSDYLRYLQSEGPRMQQPDATCARCGKGRNNLVLLRCTHDYCHDCVTLMGHDALEESPGAFGKVPKCIKCGAYFAYAQIVLPPALEVPRPAEPNDDTPGVRQKRKKTTTVKDILSTWLDEDGHMVPSSKTTAIKAQILAWKQEDPTAKIIIYTQFRTMVQILDKMCNIEGWNSRQLHGGISLKGRDENIRVFGANDDVTILISTIQSGGLGLNLTMASRVLLVDLWWNTALEDQAFCRTYRRGQEKKTAMRRLVARNTIDDQMMALQTRKEEEIDAVMTGKIYQKLSTRDLMSLFGIVKTDDSGCDFIVVGDGPQGEQQLPHGPAPDGGFGDEA